MTRRIEDLQAALNFIEEQSFGKIGVIGSSLSGCVSILTATKDKRIKALATWATPSYIGELFSREKIRYN